MPLVIEDGTGLAHANSYVSVAYADNYFLLRNNTLWASKSSQEKESALLYATLHLDVEYNWVGNITYPHQALAWPRKYAHDHEGRTIPSNIVPLKVQDATCELALQSFTPTLPTSSTNTIKRQKIGSLEIEYFDGNISQTTIPMVQQLLKNLTKNNQTSVTVFRA